MGGTIRLAGPPVPDWARVRTGETLLELLERAVDRAPRATVMTIMRGRRRERWTYRQLLAASRRAAAALAARGVVPGDRVVTWSANDPWLVVAYFAAWRLGAAIVPLDVRMAPDVAIRIGARTRSRLVLAGAGVPDDEAGALGVPVVSLTPADLDPAGEAGEAGEALLPAPPKASAIAEILFTSGTTSDPKGVVLSHAALIHNARAVLCSAGGSAERGLSLIPLSHMYGQIVPLFHGLVTGSQLTFLPSLTPAALFETLRRERITAITAVPQILQLLVDAIDGEARRTNRLEQLRRLQAISLHLPIPVRRQLFRPVLGRFGGRLRIITSGGARLPAELQLAVESMGVIVVQGYGATECAAIAGHTRTSRRPGTVGQPMIGMEVMIAPDGELLARGPNAMTGYWERPEESAEVLAGGWVHSGDAATLDPPDGRRTNRQAEIVILGRTRDRIALPNGLKVYPDDVEAELIAEPAIRAAVTLEHGPGRLVAVLLPAEPDLTAEALTSALDGAVEAANSRLAPHQRVRRWWRWPDQELPRTHTLKVRRAEVAAWLAAEAPLTVAGATIDGAPAGDDLAGVAPRTPRSTKPPRSSSRPAEPAGAPMSTADAAAAVVAAVRATLMRTHGVAPNDLSAATTVASLGLDSLAFVTLALDLEERLDAVIEVDEMSGAIDLAAIAELAASRRGAMPDDAEPSRWAFDRPARIARAVLGAVVVRPIVRLIARPRVEGGRHLRDLPEPVLICGNHTSHLDAPSILAALPAGIRSRTAVAAAADYFFDGGPLGAVTALAFGAFPFGRVERVRASLDRVAGFMGDGWNVLLFPEGGRSVSGQLGSFKDGIGLLATDLGAGVLPVYIDGAHRILPKGARLPRRRGRVTMRFGAPITMPPGTSIADATARVEDAVRALGAAAAGEEADGRRPG
jgi:long-chain acyl-CoA synthetase